MKSIRRLRRFACVTAGVGGTALLGALFGPITALAVPAAYRAAELPVPASGNAGFTEMPPARAGISFSNRVRLQLLMENNNFMQGSGVAAGDFDNDGRCDLYFCAMDGTNTLYRNLGNWRFEEVPAAAGAGCANLHSTGATFADLDGDGQLDLLVATLGNGIHCFRNEGGHFKEVTAEAGLASRSGSTSLALADVDGDGTLDLYVANYGTQAILRSGGGSAQMKRVNGQWVITGPYADRLRFVDGRLEEVGEPDVLYLNDGRGHFRALPWNSEFFLDEDGKPKAAPWDFGLSVQMRDIDGDGFPDIYVCNDFQTVDRLWLNDGTGHFRALPRLAMRHQSFASMGVDFADIDRDGRLDFFVVEMLSRGHPRRLRQLSAMSPDPPVVGRIENRPEITRNTLFWNRGDGTYAEIAAFSGLAATEWSWQPVFLDVDLDGYEDLLIVNGHAFDVQDRDVLDQIRGFGKQPPAQARTNLALYPPLNAPKLAFRNRHDRTFEEVSDAWGFNSHQIAQGIALADLDNDGDLDVVINCFNAPPLLYRNNSTAPRVAVRLAGQAPNRQGIGANIRVKGGPVPMQMQEIVCGGRYLSGDDPMRVFAAGTLTNQLTIEVRWRSGQTSEVREAIANRLYVIEEPATATLKSAPPASRQTGENSDAGSATVFFKDVSHLLNHSHHDELFNDYGRQPLLMKQLSQLGPGIAWTDLDGDGHDDLVIGAGKGGSVAVYRGNGAGEFAKMTNSQPWSAPDDVTGLAAWTSADGRRAVLAGLASYESGGSNAAAVIRCSLAGDPARFEVAGLDDIAVLGGSSGPLAVADIDGDGNLDLFVGGRMIPGAYPEAAASRIFHQENGRLVPDAANNRALEHCGLVSGAVWSDLDADGFPELILACEWGPIRVFKNDRGRLHEVTAELGLASAIGWWNGVSAGDFDEDGRLDILASNWGLNTGYEASPEHPAQLYFGDLVGRGEVDLIEAYYAADLRAVVPRRTLNALSQAFPMLREFYPTHQAFSTATVAELFRALKAQPRELKATTLATTLFLNRGRSFQAVPLAAEAQFAPAFAVNIGDFDGDGHEDVFLSQNFFGMRPEWPRLDGGRGLWLRGQGDGQLSPVPGQESGVKVYGEQRGAALGDFNEDGRIDLVVTQNGAATKLYQNVGAKPGLRVRLKGPPGNPNAIGAILRLQFGQRFGPARELHAGSGYWSQDSLVQVLATPEPPAKIHILWPGGKTQQAEVPKDTRSIEVDFAGTVRATR